MIKPKFVVKVDFGDREDKAYQYKKGDTYPRYGFEPTEERIAELTSSNNAFGVPVIEQIEDEVEDEPKETTKKSRR